MTQATLSKRNRCVSGGLSLTTLALAANADWCDHINMVTESQIRKIALALPDVSERPSYGSCPSWRTGGRMFAWIRQSPEALVVWVDSLDAKELLLEHEPEVFFTTDHYNGHPMLLVRLDRVTLKHVRSLLEASYSVRRTTKANNGQQRKASKTKKSASSPLRR